MNGPRSEVALRRAAIPGDFSRTPVPMIQVTTYPSHVRAFADVDWEDELDGRYRSWIWFRDRRGWKAAHRTARLLARGRSLDPERFRTPAPLHIRLGHVHAYSGGGA